MGCDLHLHVEIKVNDTWHHYNHPNVDRNYNLFTKMAGVRAYTDEIDPISQPKGLPEDITFTTRFDYGRENCHDESWLNIKEIEQLDNWCMKQDFVKTHSWFDDTFGYLFGNGYCEETLESAKIQDVRFVFWFDN